MPTESFWATAASIELSVIDADYATAHAQADADYHHSGGDQDDHDVGQLYHSGTAKYYIYRVTLAIDIPGTTAGWPVAGDTIVSASIFLKTESITGVETDFDVVIVSGANIVEGTEEQEKANYGNIKGDTTSYASVNTSGWSDETYKEFVLSAAAIAEIQATIDAGGVDVIIHFGVRSSRDISVTTPKLNAGTAYETISLHQNDGGHGADPDPYITLVWYSGTVVSYPTDAITRVTNLIHRYNRAQGIYDLVINLGEVTSDFGLPQWTSKTIAAVMAELGEKGVIPQREHFSCSVCGATFTTEAGRVTHLCQAHGLCP